MGLPFAATIEIDPVSRLILLQWLIGGVIALLACYHKKIGLFLSGLFSKKSAEPSPPGSQETPLMKPPQNIRREPEPKMTSPASNPQKEKVRKAA
jgi:hypothetical protein